MINIQYIDHFGTNLFHFLKILSKTGINYPEILSSGLEISGASGFYPIKQVKY